ncbi:unnamed protein product [Urochloa humidicola]
MKTYPLPPGSDSWLLETRWRQRETRRRDAELAARGGRVAARGNGVAPPHILDGDGDSDHLRRLLARRGTSFITRAELVFDNEMASF